MPLNRRIILVVGCHMDDIELACSGMIQRFAQNNCQVIGLVISTDEKRREANEKSSGMLGYELLLGNLSEEDISVQAVYPIVRGVVEKYRPDVVFGHSPHDDNHHHRIVSEATDSASRRVPNLMHFCGPLRRPEYCPNTLLTFTPEQYQKKRRAVMMLREAFGPARYFTSEYSEADAYRGQRAYEYEQRPCAPLLECTDGRVLLPYAEEFEARRLRDIFLSSLL